MLLPKMDAYCRQRRGRSLEEAVQQYAMERDLERERKPRSGHGKTGTRKHTAR